MSENIETREVSPEVASYRQGIVDLITSDLVSQEHLQDYFVAGCLPHELEFLAQLPAAEKQAILTLIIDRARKDIANSADGYPTLMTGESCVYLCKVLGDCPDDVRLSHATNMLRWAKAESQDDSTGYSMELEGKTLVKRGIISAAECVQLQTKIGAETIIREEEPL